MRFLFHYVTCDFVLPCSVVGFMCERGLRNHSVFAAAPSLDLGWVIFFAVSEHTFAFISEVCPFP